MPRYTNLNPAHRRPSRWEVLRWAVIDRITGRRKIAPAGPLPERVEPNLDLIHHTGDGTRLTWIGHASFLLSIAGAHVLIDPVFSGRVGGTYRRYTPPGLAADQLPAIDALLVTHSHYDHLDAKSVLALDRGVPVCTPAGLGNWFRKRDFRDVTELAWWEAKTLGPLTISFVPARHWTQRSLWDFNRSLWGGYVISAGAETVYHAGDSAWFDGFAEIGRRFPRIDCALLPIGGYQPGWFMERNHMTPEQAVDAFVQLGARMLVPMHWGTFRLTDEPICEPLERLKAAWEQAKRWNERSLVTPALGETVRLKMHPPSA